MTLEIELVSKWEICWALWSLVVFDPDYELTQNNIVIVFNGRFFETYSMERRLGLIGLVPKIENCCFGD